MRRIDFFIFFSIVLTVYTLVNAYIFLRGWQVFAGDSPLRRVYLTLFLAVSLSYIAGRFLERVMLNWFTDSLVWIGSFWLGAMVYFLLIVLAIDLVRLANYVVPFYPEFITAHGQRAREYLAMGAVTLVAIVVIAGHLNARSPRTYVIDLSIPKKAGGMKSLSIAMASDIHLGTIICQGRLEDIVGRINGLNPDLILLAGDVIDEDLAPVIRQNLGETLRKLTAPLGVYAITGNHEYIGGAEAAVRYLTDHGVTVLRDSSVTINGSFTLVGREDLSARQFAGKVRMPLDKLMATVDKSLPVILMDHQPFNLDSAAAAGADLQISGHTHHGQLWPFNLITNAIYEVSWGYKSIAKTHFYVSSGVGTWGPPVRIGNRPEIVNIRLAFE